jgi:hypothetical protein
MSEITDQALLSQIQLALVEPPDGGISWPSGLWRKEEVLSLLNQRQDRLLFDTLLQVGIANLTVTAGTSRVALPADWLHSVDLVWRGDDGVVQELVRSTTFEADQIITTWESTQSTPLVYIETEADHLQVIIAPEPDVNGTIELLYVPIGDECGGEGTLLTVPDEVRHGVKYGVLADLLSKDGRGKDPGRSQYCEQRYDLCVQACRQLLEGWS